MKIRNMKLPKCLLLMRKYLGMISDMIYILLFTMLFVTSFLSNTQFQIPWMEWIQEENLRSYLIEHVLFRPQRVLLIVLICRYLFSCTCHLKEYLMTALMCLCIVRACDTGIRETESIAVFLLLLLGAKDLPFRKLMWWFTFWVEVLFITTVIASQTGYVENLVYLMEGRNIRIAFGFMYPTVFAAQLFFLFLCLWYLAGERWNLTLAVGALLAAIFVYKGCEARLTTASFVLLSAVQSIRGIKIWMARKRQKFYRLDKRVADGLVVFPLVCVLGVHILSIYYNPNVEWMTGLNQLLSNRIRLAKKGIQIYGFRLWGNDIHMIGYGGSTEVQSRYFYLDSSYMQISLISGMVILGIALCLMLMACYRANKEHEWVLLWILAFASMHALFEEHLLNLAICPFLFAATMHLGKRKRMAYKVEKKEAADGKEIREG